MLNLPRILVTFGTRPEAIKMFPVVHALQRSGSFDTRVAVTAQHREMLDQVLKIADVSPDIDLDLMQAGQSLDALASRIIVHLGEALDTARPNRVLVHGDTLTTMMVSIACYFRKIPVGHVEAGLRSGDNYAPWPEEVNRRVTGVITDMHFAPTQGAADALLAENTAADTVHVTGNTVVDALLATQTKIKNEPAIAPIITRLKEQYSGKRIIAVTAHRRENFGDGMQSIAAALEHLSLREDVAIIYPVHSNPNVVDVMRQRLGRLANVALIDPLEYPDFVALMDAADLILTDSGGIQEEAPSLGKPVLVMRDVTERPEGIAAGTARLVGTDRDTILQSAQELLDDPQAYQTMARAHNPYGDGKAAQRIVSILQDAYA